jgi:hypothetical protein
MARPVAAITSRIANPIRRSATVNLAIIALRP